MVALRLTKEEPLAKKTVLVSDLSGVEIEESKGATIRITFHDARRGVRELAVKRRGRRPNSVTQ